MVAVKPDKPARDFGAGFRDLAPLWIGAIPFAFAYVIAARKAGFSPLEIQLMSLLIFSAPVQVSLVGLVATGAGVWSVLFAGLVLTAQNILYGFALSHQFRFTRLNRLIATYFLTDAAYALTIARGKDASPRYLIGAELSMFFIWNSGTLLGLILNEALVGVNSPVFGFSIPLVFLVLIVPMVRRRFDLLLIAVAAVTAYLCSRFLPGGMTVLVTALVTATVGAMWSGE